MILAILTSDAESVECSEHGTVSAVPRAAGEGYCLIRLAQHRADCQLPSFVLRAGDGWCEVKTGDGVHVGRYASLAEATDALKVAQLKAAL